MIPELITAHQLISKQINKKQLSVILSELEKTLSTEGAVVEFGCYNGTTSLFISRLLQQLGDSREFHVYDSFEGLPAKAPQDASAVGEQFVAGELAVSKKDFLHEYKKANLQPPIIHKSWFSELQDTDVPERIAFAFLDGDFYDSILDSLSLIWSRMQPGSVIIFDDYAHDALPGVAIAVKEFLPARITDTIRVEHRLGILRV